MATPTVVCLLYWQETGGIDRLFGVFSSQEAVIKHMEWRQQQGHGTDGFFVNPNVVDEPGQPCGFTKDVVLDNGRFVLVDKSVARELAQKR